MSAERPHIQASRRAHFLSRLHKHRPAYAPRSLTLEILFLWIILHCICASKFLIALFRALRPCTLALFNKERWATVGAGAEWFSSLIFFVLFGFNVINLRIAGREITPVNHGMHNWNCIWNYRYRTLITLTTGSWNRSLHTAFQIHNMKWEMLWILDELFFLQGRGVEHLFKRHCMCVTFSLGGGVSSILSLKIHTLNRHSFFVNQGMASRELWSH